MSGLNDTHANCCLNRRHFLGAGAFGLGGVALASLLQSEGLAADGPEKPPLEPVKFDLTPKKPHHDPKATAMISLFMGGGPSHIDLFDPKPLLKKYHAQFMPSDVEIKFDSAGGASKVVMASPYKFEKYGRAGIDFSELLPETAKIADEMTLVRSMNLKGIRNHVAGMQAMTFGRNSSTRPSLGSWLTYGLGAETQDLPAFVAIMADKPPGPPMWNSAGMLPAIYQGTTVRNTEPRILNLNPPPALQGRPQQLQLSLLEQLNREHAESRPGEHDLQARIASYELAARMQTAATDAFDLSKETKETRELYGIDEPQTKLLGEACLVARRLVERGVRFVQIWWYEWDMHEDIYNVLPKRCRQSDRPSSALVQDLKRRGMLDSTLVHWGGEMGRLPVIQDRGEGMKTAGRDHNTDGFSMWLAGGGVKQGHIHGATDDFGLYAVEGIAHHYDYLSTVLHLFGLDVNKLTYKQGFRNETLLDGQPGRVMHEWLA
ncbi:DUF1501 domain-containing protein [Planctomicrobium sp. SH664]|uniref:DUF1501 domain-containing protein n=1 Tax=Planctomicrobium sp. SH664 TaxID=3448125 RepID=UPI003F5B8A69